MLHQVIQETYHEGNNKDESTLEEYVRGDNPNFIIHRTIQAAVDQAEAGDIIEIKPGIYKEKLSIKTNGISLIGSGPERTIITYDDYALKDLDGEKYGTFRSYTCLVLGHGVTMKNLTIENSAGDGRQVGQALALYAHGDHFLMENCHLSACQDTLFAGPLPEAPRIPGSFVGPTEEVEYKSLHQYYYKCQITGDVDFIFGSALAVFDTCKLVTRDRQEPVNGYVTAPSTWKHEPYGFIMTGCDFVGQDGIGSQTVYLGRPWRPYGKVWIHKCRFDASIHKDYWDPWGNQKNFETSDFRFLDDNQWILNLHPWHQNILKDKESRQ